MEKQTEIEASLERAGVSCARGERLDQHTSFQIGGPADYFCTVSEVEELKAALKTAKEHGLPRFVLGKGSNVLFRDEGFPGMVIRLAGRLASIHRKGSQYTAGAGASLEDLCLQAQKASLEGLAFAYGIPGSVGGAVFMNAGAYGGEMKDILTSVRYLDEALEEHTLPAEKLALGYRSSTFQHHPWVILEAVFTLQDGNTDEILQEMQSYLEARTAKQPLEYPSAGSAFKRPRGNYAGALIDESGLRGYRVGGAAISEKHCGFIVNLGGATCRDVLQLADDVVQTVQEKTGYTLEKEMRVVDSPGQ